MKRETERSTVDGRDPRYTGNGFDPSKVRAPVEPKRHADLQGDREANRGGMREDQERK